MIIEDKIFIKYLNEYRKLHIYLPNDYDKSNDRYPVIYMYDGQNLFYEEYTAYKMAWKLQDVLDNYDKKFIVVGIECDTRGDNRMTEYFPFQKKPDVYCDYFIDGKGKYFMDFATSDLKNYIDLKYKTLSDRENTMIAGSSMGGLMSLYSILKYNNIYSKAACLSSTIFFAQEEFLKLIEESSIDRDTKIYLDYGMKEVRSKKNLDLILDYHAKVVSKLLEKCEAYMYIDPKGKHNEICWNKRIAIFLDYLWR